VYLQNNDFIVDTHDIAYPQTDIANLDTRNLVDLQETLIGKKVENIG
jgi:hypothetical protein